MLLTAIAALSGGCELFEKDGDSHETRAVAELQDSKGSFAGVAFFTDYEGGVRVALRLRGLEPGEYAVHIHEFACTPGDFQSAGGHFNPYGREHGLLNPKGPHAGDLPNITVGENGSYEGTLSASLVSLGDGANSLFKAGGTSLVIHSKPDEGKPAAESDSKRVACGAIRRAASPSQDTFRKGSGE